MERRIRKDPGGASLTPASSDLHPREENGNNDGDSRMKKAAGSGTTSSHGWIWMSMLATLYGLQPIWISILVMPCNHVEMIVWYLSSCSGRLARGSADAIIVSQVMAVDIAKIICSLAVVLLDGSAWRLWHSWRIREFLQGSMVPAFVYTVQNVLINIAYRHLHPVTFAMLSQTKLLFTALFNFIFLRQKQSWRQVLALLTMLVAAVLLSIADHVELSLWGGKGAGEGGGERKEGSGGLTESLAASVVFGVVPMLAASVTSGFGSMYCQWVSQVKGRSSYLMTVEMSSFSFCLLLASLLLVPSSHDAVRMRQLGFFHAWTLLSTVPILNNALAGILVGVVVQVSGGLKKGFVMIIALLVTAAAQLLLEGEPPPLLVWVAFPMVVASTHMHAAYPSLLHSSDGGIPHGGIPHGGIPHVGIPHGGIPHMVAFPMVASPMVAFPMVASPMVVVSSTYVHAAYPYMERKGTGGEEDSDQEKTQKSCASSPIGMDSVPFPCWQCSW
ncbi:unnamed protein product [Closterium sp. Yama58-4]|nr:unnamed protein product [Closterium sp. Yama58-4]